MHFLLLWCQEQNGGSMMKYASQIESETSVKYAASVRTKSDPDKISLK